MYVGGTSSGFELVDPMANLHALGIATPQDVAASQVTFGTTAFGSPATQFGAMGGGYVGGSWSPEPIGNNQILYGHYSSQGAVALPQAYYGQQASYNPASFGLPAASTPQQPAAATAQPSTAAGGAQQPGAQQPAAQQQDKATPRKPAPKPEPKTATVRAGDNLSTIAAKHGISWQDLYQANKATIGSNPNLIRPGQELKLPAK